MREYREINNLEPMSDGRDELKSKIIIEHKFLN